MGTVSYSFGKPYGYTGKAGTCRWCGDRLVYRTFSRNLLPGETWEEFHAIPQSQKRSRAYDKPGYYGDGKFCGLRCGYQWAVRRA